MKTPKEIKRKIKDFRFRHLQKLYKKHLSTRPENCKYNFRQPISVNETVGLCLYGDAKNEHEWQGTICEHLEDAQNCKLFKCFTTKKQLAIQYEKDIEDSEICKQKYKEVYALKWVLEDNPSLLKRFIHLFFRVK